MGYFLALEGEGFRLQPAPLPDRRAPLHDLYRLFIISRDYQGGNHQYQIVCIDTSSESGGCMIVPTVLYIQDEMVQLQYGDNTLAQQIGGGSTLSLQTKRMSL